MATTDITQALFAPGRFCISPTDIAIPFPHGGDALGFKRDAAWEPRILTSELIAEEYGGETVEAIESGQSGKLVAELRGWDADAIPLFHPGATVSNAKRPRVTHPNTVRRGRFRSRDRVALLFSPDDFITHPAIYFPAAIPLVDEAARVTLDLREEGSLAVVFLATRRQVDIGGPAQDIRASDVVLLEDLIL